VTDLAPTPDGSAADRGRLDRLLDIIPDVYVLVDARCHITWVSASAQPVLGRSPDEVVGTLAYDLFAKPDNRELHEAYFAGVLASPGQHGPVEVTITHPDGHLSELEVLLNNALDDPEVGAVVGSIRDITRRAGDIEELRRREAWADALIRRGSELIMVTDRSGIVTFANPAAERVLGVGADDLVGTCWLDAVVEADDVDPAAFVDVLLDHPVDRPVPLRARRADGSVRHLGVYASNLMADPDVGGVVVNASDLTDRWMAESFLAEQASLLEAMTRGLPFEATLRWLCKVVEDRIPGAVAAVGTLRDDGWIRNTPSNAFPAELRSALDDLRPDSELGRRLRETGDSTWFVAGLTGPGWDDLADAVTPRGLSACWVRGFASRQSGELLGSLTVFHTDERLPEREERALLDRVANLAAVAVERHRLERALEHRAQHDGLTGLPNRVAILEHIDALLGRPDLDAPVVVMFVDLDRFKVINDSLGHAVGDVLLVHVAERFRSSLRPGDVIGRFGGDEFVVVCDGIDEPGAVAVADRLRSSLAEPIEVEGTRMFVTASIGIARSGDPAADPDSLIRDADVAMYQSKMRGRDTATLYELGSQERVARSLDLEGALRGAIVAGELDVHYQPVVDLSDGRLIAFEALVRWDRPGVGPVAPIEIISVAEESGLILPLGRHVLAMACERAAVWAAKEGSIAPVVSVNVSGRQLADPSFPGHVAAALESSGLAPRRLCLEITETSLIDQSAHDAVTSLKALGVMLAIDDFGTGHASLDVVRRLVGVDVVKIDRSFVAGVDAAAGHDRAIVAAVIALADALGMDVVAEGVETPDQAAALVDMGCRFGQGYWYGRPSPAAVADEHVVDASAVASVPPRS
jgi:diguanylate cyclase (GGDEF)-like protein/PAS domain S-box-containing protein